MVVEVTLTPGSVLQVVVTGFLTSCYNYTDVDIAGTRHYLKQNLTKSSTSEWKPSMFGFSSCASSDCKVFVKFAVSVFNASLPQYYNKVILDKCRQY